MSDAIAYQGEAGAFSHLACLEAYSALAPLACVTFDAAFAAVAAGEARVAMIPVENSVAGRVADIHHLLPDSALHIVAEHFLPVRHQLLAAPGVALADITAVRSHPMALAQCRKLIAEHGWRAVRETDTAASARQLAEAGARDEAAIASDLAGRINRLDAVLRDVHDDASNTTRFIVLAREPQWPEQGSGPCVTSLLFRVRNVPAALYKAMGGFSTNGVNMTKLESYQLDGGFTATQFYADVEGHPDDRALANALQELEFFSTRTRIVGVYPADAYRSRVAD